MMTPLLATKLYVPPPRINVVRRPRLSERLNAGMQHKLTLISAPAGFGKTTLVSEWLAGRELSAAWLSLDGSDNDPARFLTYLVAAVQTVAPHVGEGVLRALQAPQPPPTEAIVTTLLNDLASMTDDFVLVLDDYHVVEAKSVDYALTLLLDHLPPWMHLVIATREDPQLPLARMRAGGQLTELRVADLRFTPAEAAEFLSRVMGLSLSADDVAALESRTEGWIAGLQLAAISLQGHPDATSFIGSFTGSHHFVMDYVLVEVLQRQPERIQTFLLRTSILDRLCGPLCDAVVRNPAAPGEATLEALERANLFIVPLDNERQWYRYHHLFADLLRQRLRQRGADSPGKAGWDAAALHQRASQWYEDHGLMIEAFHHAVAANDFERTVRLVEGKEIPLHYRGVVTAMLDWLATLPTAVLDARPSLWVRYATLLLVNGHTTGVEEKLQAAEAALQDRVMDQETRNLIGQIANSRATVALTRYQPDIMLAQSHRALEYLHPSNLSLRATAHWNMGVAYSYLGERVAARRDYTEAIALGQASKDVFTTILATIGLGNVQEFDNELHLAAETYRHVLHMAGEQPLQIIGEVHIALSHILYEWNDLDAAEQHGREALELERQYESIIDRFILCEVFLARLKLARGDVAGAAALLAQTGQSARQRNFVLRMPEIAAAQVVVLLHQGKVAAAAELAQSYDLPISRARVQLAEGDPAAALATLEPWRHHVEAKGWQDQRLTTMALQTVTLQACSKHDAAVQLLLDALALAEPGGFIRTFVDEGPPMARLLTAASGRGRMTSYIAQLLAAFGPTQQQQPGAVDRPPVPPALFLIEPLSQREREVLRLIAQGLSNQEISERLFLALDTVKGHNRKIFDKLQVQRRTEAVARARELGLL